MWCDHRNEWYITGFRYPRRPQILYITSSNKSPHTTTRSSLLCSYLATPGHLPKLNYSALNFSAWNFQIFSCVHVVLYSGAVNMVKENTKEVVEILTGCDDTLPSTEEPCNKETGERSSLNMKSRGYVFIVTAGGYIQTFSPIYRYKTVFMVFIFTHKEVMHFFFPQQMNKFGTVCHSTKILFIVSMQNVSKRGSCRNC